MNNFKNFHYQYPSRLSRFLERALAQSGQKNHQIINVVGSHSNLALSLSFASNNSSNFNNLNSLIVVSSFDEAKRIQASLLYFSAEFNVHILDGFDVSLRTWDYTPVHTSSKTAADFITGLNKSKRICPKTNRY